MNAFDLVSHFFALLPIYLTYAYRLPYLLVLSVFTVLVSLLHHWYPENNLFTHIDEFFASSLIFITFLVYIENAYVFASASVFLLLFVVYFDVFVDIDLVTIFVGLVVFCSFFMFAYDREIRHAKNKVYDIWNAYFISFLSTQALAIGFYLWGAYDVDEPYAHAFWHVFAFVSFASLVVHISENPNETLNRVLFYWLGSIPSRLFISWVFIDWGKASWDSRAPVVVIFLLLAVPIVLRRSPELFSLETAVGVLYVIVNALIIAGLMSAAGWVLLSSTCVSSAAWFMRNDISTMDLEVKRAAKPVMVVVGEPVRVDTKKTKIQLRL